MRVRTRCRPRGRQIRARSSAAKAFVLTGNRPFTRLCHSSRQNGARMIGANLEILSPEVAIDLMRLALLNPES